MNFVSSYIIVLIIGVLIIGVAVPVARRRRADASESRMKRMMVCCGIDQVGAKYADHLLKLDMRAVRERCRNCPDTKTCDHWLDGEAIAASDFCPNAQQFAAAAASRARVAR
jgi:hypothetical protein